MARYFFIGVIAVVVAGVVAGASCGLPDKDGCRTADDCVGGRVCMDGRCVGGVSTVRRVLLNRYPVSAVPDDGYPRLGPCRCSTGDRAVYERYD